MTERPILFSGPMVRALLDGTKTQTRRVVKNLNPTFVASNPAPHEIANAARCPYGVVGDRLWCRETWGQSARNRTLYPASPELVEQISRDEQWVSLPRWRPSIHMPRWASRITLEITDVRVERVQAISEDDAKAEGVKPNYYADLNPDGTARVGESIAYRAAFHDLWDSLNGPRGFGWTANPWVWSLSFRRVPDHA